MVRHKGSVLVDTNVILECQRTDSWRALANGYELETVEDCVSETQTGFQLRRDELLIDEHGLRFSLKAIHEVQASARAKLSIEVPDIHLDQGEAALWAHARSRIDNWVFCGPDKASLRVGIRLGYRARLVSLEQLLTDVGHRPRYKLKPAYTSKWHRTSMNQLGLEESG
ncbi:MAG: hypothetical protein OXG08_03290 [Gammaproteobacteria bacterium]|nr:hypothetical protein [Gammaproteobacteria bacterium]